MDKQMNKVELITLAVMLQDEDEALKLIKKPSYEAFSRWANVYATKPEGWEDRYKTLNGAIRKAICNYIDNNGCTPEILNKYFTRPKQILRTKGYHQSNPCKSKYPIVKLSKPKPKAKAKVKLKASNSIAKPVKEDESLSKKEAFKLLMATLDTIKELVKKL